MTSPARKTDAPATKAPARKTDKDLPLIQDIRLRRGLNILWAPPSPAGAAGDLGPEGMVFIPAAQSPTGGDLLVVANEISGTTSFFSIEIVE